MAKDNAVRGGARSSRILLMTVPLLLFASVGVLFFVLMLDEDRDPTALESAFIGRPPPTLSMPGLRPGEADLSNDVIGGRPILVNFFASWCVQCRAEMSILVELAEGRGVDIVGVDYVDDPVKALRLLEQYGDPYVRTGVDPEGRIGLEWGIYGLPETFVVDAEGIVLLRHVGAVDLRSIEQHIMPALEGVL